MTFFAKNRLFSGFLWPLSGQAKTGQKWPKKAKNGQKWSKMAIFGVFGVKKGRFWGFGPRKRVKKWKVRPDFPILRAKKK